MNYKSAKYKDQYKNHKYKDHYYVDNSKVEIKECRKAE